MGAPGRLAAAARELEAAAGAGAADYGELADIARDILEMRMRARGELAEALSAIHALLAGLIDSNRAQPGAVLLVAFMAGNLDDALAGAPDPDAGAPFAPPAVAAPAAAALRDLARAHRRRHEFCRRRIDLEVSAYLTGLADSVEGWAGPDPESRVVPLRRPAGAAGARSPEPAA